MSFLGNLVHFRSLMSFLAHFRSFISFLFRQVRKLFWKVQKLFWQVQNWVVGPESSESKTCLTRGPERPSESKTCLTRGSERPFRCLDLATNQQIEGNDQQ